MKKMRKNKRVYHLSKTLTAFVEEKFELPANDPQLQDISPEEFQRELEFYLGCLVYPKEMTSAKV